MDLDVDVQVDVDVNVDVDVVVDVDVDGYSPVANPVMMSSSDRWIAFRPARFA